MIRKIVILAATVASVIGLAAPAWSATVVCRRDFDTGNADVGCKGFLDLNNDALSVRKGTVATGQSLIVTPVAFTRRQDFIMQRIPGLSGEYFMWAPRDVPSNLCLTAHGAGQRVTLAHCTSNFASASQRWHEWDTAPGHTHIQNVATGRYLVAENGVIVTVRLRNAPVVGRNWHYQQPQGR